MSDLMPQECNDQEIAASIQPENSLDILGGEAESSKQKGGRKALSPELFQQSPIDAYKRLLNLFTSIGVNDVSAAQSIVGDAFNWQLGTVTQSLEEQFALLPDNLKQAFLVKVGASVQSSEPAKAKSAASRAKPTITTTLSIE